MLWNFYFLLLSEQPFQNIGGFRRKTYFTDYQTTNAIQLFVAIKEIFYLESCNEAELLRDYLRKVATCLFIYH